MNRIEAFEVLGLNGTETDKEIRKRYLYLVKKYHPDKNPNDKDALQKLQEINLAKEIIDKEEDTIYICDEVYKESTFDIVKDLISQHRITPIILLKNLYISIICIFIILTNVLFTVISIFLKYDIAIYILSILIALTPILGLVENFKMSIIYALIFFILLTAIKEISKVWENKYQGILNKWIRKF